MRTAAYRTIVGLVVAVPIVVSGVAAADNYPINNGSLGVTSNGSTSNAGSQSDAVAPGAVITLSGGGFAPGAQVTLLLHSTPVVLATTTADATGWIHVSVTIPAGARVGQHTLVAEGPAPGGGTVILTKKVAVRSTTGVRAASAASLPFTGAEIGAMAVIGGAAVIAGSGALLASRRRAAR